LIVIDDLATRPHDCDLLLDQNLGREVSDYAGLIPNGCTLLLGPAYALLRPEFEKRRKLCQVREELNRVLVFFSGSDEGNETEKALQGLLEATDEWFLDVVIGTSHPRSAALQSLADLHPTRVTVHIQTDKMDELMGHADVAVGAAGSASWERCALRLPALICVLAENQTTVAYELQRVGAAINLGVCHALTGKDYAKALLSLDVKQLRRMSACAAGVTDGLGASRVARYLSALPVCNPRQTGLTTKLRA
jgi:UDP-2,4-diacetamido-2,4,6-trideoxy-beta-L-altropyranose hydrolase